VLTLSTNISWKQQSYYSYFHILCLRFTLCWKGTLVELTTAALAPSAAPERSRDADPGCVSLISHTHTHTHTHTHARARAAEILFTQSSPRSRSVKYALKSPVFGFFCVSAHVCRWAQAHRSLSAWGRELRDDWTRENADVHLLRPNGCHSASAALIGRRRRTQRHKWRYRQVITVKIIQYYYSNYSKQRVITNINNLSKQIHII